MNYLKNNRGFSLIEIIFAFVIVLALLAAFTGGIIANLRSETVVDNRMIASNTASNIIEYLRIEQNIDDIRNSVSGSLSINVSNGGVDNSDIDEYFGENEDIFGDLNYNSVEISYEPFNGRDNLLKVDIEIGWREGNENKKFELSTLMAVD